MFNEILTSGKIDEEREMKIYPFGEEYFKEDQDIEEIIKRMNYENLYRDKDIWADRVHGRRRKEYLPKLTRLK